MISGAWLWGLVKAILQDAYKYAIKPKFKKPDPITPADLK